MDNKDFMERLLEKGDFSREGDEKNRIYRKLFGTEMALDDDALADVSGGREEYKEIKKDDS